MGRAQSIAPWESTSSAVLLHLAVFVSQRLDSNGQCLGSMTQSSFNSQCHEKGVWPEHGMCTDALMGWVAEVESDVCRTCRGGKVGGQKPETREARRGVGSGVAMPEQVESESGEVR